MLLVMVVVIKPLSRHTFGHRKAGPYADTDTCRAQEGHAKGKEEEKTRHTRRTVDWDTSGGDGGSSLVLGGEDVARRPGHLR